jgi:hypothetical protein
MDTRLQESKPREFVVKLESGTDRIDITIYTGIWGSTLRMSVAPPSLLNGSALYDLQQWGEKYRSHAVVNFWTASWFVWIIVLTAVTAWSSVILFALRERALDAPLTKRAAALVQEGITDRNLKEAVQILLKLRTGTGRDESKAIPLTWSVLLWCGYLAMCVILICAPRSVLAIGKGRQALKRQECWLNFPSFGGRGVWVRRPARTLRGFCSPTPSDDGHGCKTFGRNSPPAR